MLAVAEKFLVIKYFPEKSITKFEFTNSSCGIEPIPACVLNFPLKRPLKFNSYF